MKTIYIKKLKSGNYEISNKAESTEKFNTKKSLEAFFNNISKTKSNVWNKSKRTYNFCQVVKARYSQSQTYFNSFLELSTL